ncbi:MAG TPA: DNA polymerase [Methanosarcinales archaeon]|nr:DNA polymerase [Methanosarcinales archaeon]
MPFLCTKYLAVDTETTGLNPFKGARPFLFIFCNENHDVKLVHLDPREDNSKSVKYLWMKKVMGNMSIQKIFHNAAFDIAMFDAIGIETRGIVHDTMTIMRLHNAYEQSYALKPLAGKYLNDPCTDEKEVKLWLSAKKSATTREITKTKKIIKTLESDGEPVPKSLYTKIKLLHNYWKTIGYHLVPKETMDRYAHQDGVRTMSLFQIAYQSAVRRYKDIYTIERKLIPVIYQMTKRGVIVDVDECLNGSVMMSNKINIVANEIYEIAGKKFDIGSHKQLAKVLFIDLGLEVKERTANGNPTTKEDTMKLYDEPIANKIRLWRFYTKMKDTYFDGMLEHIDDEGAIHGRFNQYGTKTGRFSSSEPNLQNIPRPEEEFEDPGIRKLFIVRKGYTNFYIDYKQIEMYLFAHYSKDKRMLPAAQKGEDIYTEAAKGLFAKEDISKEERRITKTICLGIIYGMGVTKMNESLRKQLSHNADQESTQNKNFVGKFHAAFPTIAPMIKHYTQSAESGMSIVDVFGRVHMVDPRVGYRAVNALIQGTAATIIKIAMLKCANYLKDKKSNMLMTIHDELVFEVHDDEIPTVPIVLKKLMEDFGKYNFRVPIIAEVSASRSSWYDKTNVDVHKSLPF